MSVLHNDAGAALFNQAEVHQAAAAFTRAIECNPRVARYRLNRAEAALAQHMYGLARDDVLAALRFDPTSVEALRLLAKISPT